jgi:Zn-dependent M28 family amino/carboxypeptidase
MKKHLPLDRKMLGEIYASDEIEKNFRALCDDLPHRFAGSENEKEGAGYVARAMRRYGLENVLQEKFPILGWERSGPSRLRVVSPAERELPCIALPYSPSTPTRGRKLELLDLGYATPEEIEDKGSAVRGKAVLVLLGQPVGYRRYHRAEKFGRVVEAGASAFVFQNSSPGDLEPTGSARFGREAEIPAVGISQESGAYLGRLLEKKPVTILLRTAGTTRKMTSRNVVGDIPGKRAELVLLGGHLDTHDIAPGASDNTSGVVAVLECARVMRDAGVRPLRTIRFVAFGCEEHGLNGSEAYLDQHAEEIPRVRLMCNVDTVPATLPMGVEYHLWPRVDRFTGKAAAEMNRRMPVVQALSPYSDHFNFFLRGVPTCRIFSHGDPRRVRGWGHTRADTLDKMDFQIVRSCVDLTARFLLRVADDPAWPLRQRSPGEVAEIAAWEGLDEVLEYEK